MSEIAGVIFTEAIAKNLFETFDKLNRFMKDGNANLNDGFTALSSFASAFNPFALPLKNIFVQIQSETMEETMHLMKEAFELAQNPVVSAGLELTGNILENMLNIVADGLDETETALNGMQTFGDFIKEFIKDPNKTLLDLWNAWTGMGS